MTLLAWKTRRWKQLTLSRRRSKKHLRRLRTKSQWNSAQGKNLQQAHLLAPKRYVKDLDRVVNALECPKRINLSDNYEETIGFLEKVRTVAKRLHGRLHVDFTVVEEISPAGALLLVAEFDKWRRILPDRRLKPVSLSRWNPNVRRKLKEMGFFEMLGTRCDVLDEVPADADQYVPFLAGDASEGAQAKVLRKSIEALGPKLADRGALYDGLVEAMTNVKQHAYRRDDRIKLWWTSASVNIRRNKLTVMFLDHGASIPGTLPRSEIWEVVRGFMKKINADPFKDDAKLIQAALAVEKSRTGLEHRGNGLRQDIKGYIDSHAARGTLRIFSRRGKIVYMKEIDGTEKTEVHSLTTPIRGTFLEWTVEEYAE